MSEHAATAPSVEAPGHEHHDPPYYKVLGALTVLTVVEIFWPMWFLDARGVLVLGLSVMAGAKALLVAMYYMHLRYDSKVLWFVMAFPLLLVVVMIAGLLPDAVGYNDLIPPLLP